MGGREAGQPRQGFLGLLGEDDRRELMARAGRRRFKAGSRMMHEGAPGAEVMILLSGRVKVDGHHRGRA